jgi:mycothiol maleylpyruvate isomerase-like protein
MMTVVPDLPAVRDAFETESGRVAQRVRAARQLTTPIPRLAWTVGQLVAHLCVVYQSFAATMRGEFAATALDGVVQPDRTLPETIAAANAFAVGLVDFADPSEAADALHRAAADLVSVLGESPDPLLPCPAPWYGPGRTRTVGTLASLAVSETLVHGYDLARATSSKALPSAASAALVAPTVMSEMLPLLLDIERAGGFRGSFEIRVRGGAAFVLRIDAGTVRTAPVEGQEVDCVVSLNACSALMIGYARESVAHALLTGGTFAFGRRPWLGLQMRGLFLTP